MLLNLENKTFLADFYVQQKSRILLSGELLGGFSHVGCLLFFFRVFLTLLFNIILYQVYPYGHLHILHFQVNSMQSDLQHFIVCFGRFFAVSFILLLGFVRSFCCKSYGFQRGFYLKAFLLYTPHSSSDEQYSIQDPLYLPA